VPVAFGSPQAATAHAAAALIIRSRYRNYRTRIGHHFIVHIDMVNSEKRHSERRHATWGADGASRSTCSPPMGYSVARQRPDAPDEVRTGCVMIVFFGREK